MNLLLCSEAIFAKGFCVSFCILNCLFYLLMGDKSELGCVSNLLKPFHLLAYGVMVHTSLNSVSRIHTLISNLKPNRYLVSRILMVNLKDWPA